MADQTQELKRLLDARDLCLLVDSTKMTARLPVFSDGRRPLTLDSRLAYFACTTLRDLGTAKDDTLWEMYGDIVSK